MVEKLTVEDRTYEYNYGGIGHGAFGVVYKGTRTNKVNLIGR